MFVWWLRHFSPTKASFWRKIHCSALKTKWKQGFRNVQNGKYLFINGLLKISFLHTFAECLALEDSCSFTTNANIYFHLVAGCSVVQVVRIIISQYPIHAETGNTYLFSFQACHLYSFKTTMVWKNRVSLVQFNLNI